MLGIAVGLTDSTFNNWEDKSIAILGISLSSVVCVYILNC